MKIFKLWERKERGEGEKERRKKREIIITGRPMVSNKRRRKVLSDKCGIEPGTTGLKTKDKNEQEMKVSVVRSK